MLDWEGQPLRLFEGNKRQYRHTYEFDARTPSFTHAQLFGRRCWRFAATMRGFRCLVFGGGVMASVEAVFMWDPRSDQSADVAPRFVCICGKISQISSLKGAELLQPQHILCW